MLLRHLGAITESALESALESQRASGRRLGAELQHMGLVEPEVVLKALAAQGGVSYLPSFDVNRVMAGPSWLPAETVRALGLVPFEVDESQKRLRVVCAPPVPRSAMRALLKLTGWTAEPYLVHDEDWQDALHAVSPGVPGNRAAPRSRDRQRQRRRGRAALRTTRSLDRTVTMRAANCDQYTWVRVEGARQVSDLLIPAMEEPCQAARIAR